MKKCIQTCYSVLFSIQIFMLLGGMCFLLSIGHGIWESNRGYHFQAFLPWERYITSSAASSALAFWSYFIVLNTMVPISLYVRWASLTISALFLF